MELKSDLTEYTEQEFKALIEAIDDADTEEVRGELVEHFNKLVPHPAGSDLLFYPEDGTDDSPEGVVETIKSYCQAHHLQGFKE
jgi:hypothetical protein